MLKRTLRLRTPEHIGRNVDRSKAIHLSANVAYRVAV
jgi:hypothetical protein